MGFKKYSFFVLKIFVAILVVVLLSQSVVGALPRVSNKANIDKEISKLRGELEYVSEQERKETENYLRVRAERIQVDNELASLNNKIRQAQQRQRKAQETAEQARAEFAHAQAKLDEAQREREQARKLRQRAIINLYQGSSETELSPSVLSAEPEERQNVVRKQIFLKKYNQSQVNAIRTAGEKAGDAILERLAHEEARKRAEEAEAEAKKEGDILKPLQDELVKKQREAKEKEAAEQALVSKLRSKKSSYNRQIDQLQAESNRLAEEIRRQQQNANNGSNSGGSNGGSSGGSSGGNQNTGAMTRPVPGPITSAFGYRTHPIYGDARLHAGVDFGSGHGTPIKAARSGRVIVASFLNGYGNTLIVDHGGGVSTLYAHQSSFAVSNGARVTQGQVIGYVGATGQVTGPHLHWEVRVNGTPVNPMTYL